MIFKSGMNRPEPCRENTFGCFLPLGESHAIYCVEGGLNYCTTFSCFKTVSGFSCSVQPCFSALIFRKVDCSLNVLYADDNGITNSVITTKRQHTTIFFFFFPSKSNFIAISSINTYSLNPVCRSILRASRIVAV